MDASPAAPGADGLAQPALAATDASRLLALVVLAVLGPALHALAAGRLARLTAGQQELGAARLLLLHAALVGLLASALHAIPLAQWSLGAGSLGETTCRLGRAATDALYATQSLLLTTALLSVLTRPPGLLLAVLLLVIWLLGPGLNFGHVHWRVTAGAPYGGPFVEGGPVAFHDNVIIDEAIAAAGRDSVTSASLLAATVEPTTSRAAAEAALVAAHDSAIGAAIAAAGAETAPAGPLTGCVQEEAGVPLWFQSRA